MAIPEPILALVREAEVHAHGRHFEDIQRPLQTAISRTVESKLYALGGALKHRLGEAAWKRGLYGIAVQQWIGGVDIIKESGIDIFRSPVDLKRFEPDTGTLTIALAADLHSGHATSADLAAEADDPALGARLLLDAGNAYLRWPQLSAAYKQYDAVHQLKAAGAAPWLVAFASTGAAVVLTARGEFDRADGLLQQASGLLHDSPELRRVIAARGLLHYARALVAGTGDVGALLDAAEADYRRALDLHRSAKDGIGQARSHLGLGLCAVRRLDWSGGLAEFQETYRLAYGNYQTQQGGELWYLFRWGLGVCNRGLGHVNEAVRQFGIALQWIGRHRSATSTVEGKVSFLNLTAAVTDPLMEIRADRSDTDRTAWRRALQVAEESRARALRDLFYQHNRLHTAAAPELKPDEVEKSAADDVSTDVASPSPPVTRLVYYLLPDRILIIIASTDGRVVGRSVPVPREDLTSRLDALRRALHVDRLARGVTFRAAAGLAETTDAAGSWKDLLLDLYKVLIHPIEDFLPAAGESIQIEPHGVLWTLPFAALLCDAGGVWFGQKWRLVHAPSRNLIDAIRARPAPSTIGKALVVGNPTMPRITSDNGDVLVLEPLSGAESEAGQIADLLAATKLIGPDATQAAVESAAPQQDVIHLATHGIAYPDDPLGSFVALAPTPPDDGRLTARRVLGITGGLRADLVTLSACQTALGRVGGDGMMGLSSAFLAAGARAVLVSLWSVDDDATARLMDGFYQRYRKHRDKALALQGTMDEMRVPDPLLSPALWAPFILVGVAH